MATLDLVGRPTGVTGGVQMAQSGDTLTLLAGVIADMTAGTFKLPLQFYVGAVQTSTNVTGTNLNTLTAGSSSNADSLHTHTATQSVTLDLTGQTLWATPASGEIGYISGDNTLAKAKADSMTTARAIGAYQGTAGTVLIGGAFNVFLQASLNAGAGGPPAAGQPLYVSATVGGQVQNFAPQTATQVEAQIGILLVAAGYSNGAGSAQKAIWQPKDPIQL